MLEKSSSAKVTDAYSAGVVTDFVLNEVTLWTSRSGCDHEGGAGKDEHKPHHDGEREDAVAGRRHSHSPAVLHQSACDGSQSLLSNW